MNRWCGQGALRIGTIFLALISTASTLRAGSPQPRQAKSWRVPYYSRRLRGDAHSVLCLTTRISRVPLLFGHSGLSEFKLADTLAPSDDWQSFEVRSAGFHQYRRPQVVNGKVKDLYLQYDSSEDHFLAFSSIYRTWSVNSIHCVPITRAESKGLWAWLDSQRESTWLFTFNCNDMASIAFRKATGIDFTKVSSRLLVSTPDSLRAAVKNYQNRFIPEGVVIHTPTTPGELRLLEDLEVTNRISVSPFW